MGREVPLPTVYMPKPFYFDLDDSEFGLHVVWCVAPLSRYHAGSCTKAVVAI